jgi:SAM-dependent methyltransferase
LLNRAARYFPILRELRQYTGSGGSVLDVGSGPIGIGEFWPCPFVGCDVGFAVQPRKPMRPVICSGMQLPFLDRSFDAVVASDVMEHVPPENRQELIREILRVARKVAVFAYPCGPAAHASDKKLRGDYLSRMMAPPIWLEEHMLYPFPNEDLFRDTPSGWEMKVVPNESLGFHYWMMRKEMRVSLNRLFRLGLLIAPGVIESLLRRVDREPSYRKIFFLTRQEQMG